MMAWLISFLTHLALPTSNNSKRFKIHKNDYETLHFRTDIELHILENEMQYNTVIITYILQGQTCKNTIKLSIGLTKYELYVQLKSKFDSQCTAK